MKEKLHNILDDTKFPQIGNEFFETLLSHKNVTIELIRSNNVKNGVLYNQKHDEWVVVLEGNAILEVEEIRHSLHKGDSLFIKADTPHSVISTDEKTLWLAVHIY